MAKKVFLSYSRYDLPFAVGLHDYLARNDVSVWMDLGDLSVGDRWRAEIHRAIDECAFFVVIVSPFSASSEVVREEIAAASRSGKPIIPVLLQDCDAPEDLRERNWIDSRMRYGQARRQLLMRLGGRKVPIREAFIPPPHRPGYPFGFKPIMMLPAPLTVRLCLSVAMLGLFYKLLLAAVGWFYFPRVGNHLPFPNYAIWLVIAGGWQTLAAYRMLRRRQTFKQMATLYLMLAIMNMLGLMWTTWSLTAPFSSILLIQTLVDFSLLLNLFAGSSRRWMIAYPYSKRAHN